MMYLEDVRGDVKISDEHTEYMWASIEKIKTLNVSTSLKKLLEKTKNSIWGFNPEIGHAWKNSFRRYQNVYNTYANIINSEDERIKTVPLAE